MATTKPHKEYSELVDLLKTRNMIIEDPNYASKKLAQVGYYRLSGFWFISRESQHYLENNILKNRFIDRFLPQTSFNQVYKLYLFDKKLRLLLLDIIERLEVNIRSVIAHELGRYDPLAYKNSEFIKIKSKNINKQYSEKWLPKLEQDIKKSKSEFITYHRDNYKDIPFWVIIEIWDFGMLSKYYSFLKGSYQNKIAKNFGIDGNTFGTWLHEINILRNLCAHHVRIWNKNFNAIPLPDTSLYPEITINTLAENRILGRIFVLWFLIKHTNSVNYKWLEKFFQLINNDFPFVPNANLSAMGWKEN